MNLQKAIHKSIRSLKYHSPTILSCLAVVGLVGTAVLTAKSAQKAMKLIEKAEDNKGDELTILETVVAATPAYIPSIAVGAATIACVLGANVLSRKQQASIISAYALLDKSYKSYRKAANTVYGDDADSKIKTEMAKETYVSADGVAVYIPDLDADSEEVLFYDTYGKRYFTSTMASVINAQYHINRNLTLRGDVSLNEFYKFLGLDPIESGNEVGWLLDDLMESGIMWLDFDNRYVKLDDGLECCIISTLWGEPTLMFSND